MGPRARWLQRGGNAELSANVGSAMPGTRSAMVMRRSTHYRPLGAKPKREGSRMKASIFCLPSVGSRAEIEAGMAATRPELYQRMLKELTELVKLADDLGYDSVSFTEHHFHIEGFELSNNPVLLDLYFAMQ